MLIGEVARSCGVSARTLRHYDALGLVRPIGRTSGGYREYSDDDIRRLFHVECLRMLGLPLGQIGRALDDPTAAPSDLVGDLILATERRLEQERALLARLRAIDASGSDGWGDVLRVIELMRGLGAVSPATRQRTVLAYSDRAAPAALLVEVLLTETDPNVAGALRWSLARAGDEGVAALTDALASTDADIRRRAVRALAELPESPVVDPSLMDALGDDDADVRGHAAVTLARRGVTEAWPTLVDMLVGGCRDVEADEALRALSGIPGVAEQITGALAEELAEPAADTATPIRLAQALRELDTPTARGVLRGLADDPDRAVARVASAFVSGTR